MITQNSSTAKIAHESEVNRQHIRIKLSATAVINKKKFRIRDLSSGGMSVEASHDIFTNETHDIKILFNFDNFAFHLNVKARPVYYKDETAGFVFTALNARQVSLLNYIIKSYLSGLIISEGDIINVATRNDFTKLREAPKSNDNDFNNWVNRIVPLGALLLLGLAGLFFLFGNIYENAVVIKSPFAIVEANEYTVRAERNGVYHPLLAQGATKVAKGQSLGVIKADSNASGDQTTVTANDYIVKSPCDCVIITQASQEGEFRTLGEPLFRLMPLDAKPWITANLSPEQMHRLKLLDSANIKLVGDGKFHEGHITSFLPPSFNQEFVQVKVKPKEPLPLDAVGRQAYVEFSVY